MGRSCNSVIEDLPSLHRILGSALGSGSDPSSCQVARILYPSCCWGARILGPQRPCPRGQSAQFATHPTTQSASLAATKQKADFQTIFFYWCCPMPPLWHQCSNIGWPWPPPGQDPRGSHWIRALWARIQGGDPRGMCTGSKLSTWQGCRSEQPPQNCSDSAKAARGADHQRIPGGGVKQPSPGCCVKPGH